VSLPAPPSSVSLKALPIRVSSPSLPLSVHPIFAGTVWVVHGDQNADSVSLFLPPSTISTSSLMVSPSPRAPSSCLHTEQNGTGAPA
jgi:hypothetical protein